MTGTVIRILTFGAIVELAEGVTGLLHISQISSEKIRKVEDVLRVNDVVNVRILEVLKDERKIKLSMKDVEGNEGLFNRAPEEVVVPENPVEQTVEPAEKSALNEVSSETDAVPSAEAAPVESAELHEETKEPPEA